MIHKMFLFMSLNLDSMGISNQNQYKLHSCNYDKLCIWDLGKPSSRFIRGCTLEIGKFLVISNVQGFVIVFLIVSVM